MDLNNYKGIYFEDDNEKYQCPETGAHFRFEDLCRRMEKIRIKRGDPNVKFDKKGNKIYPDQVNTASKPRDISNRVREFSEELTNEDLDEHKNSTRKELRTDVLKKDVKAPKRLGEVFGGDETAKATGS